MAEKKQTDLEKIKELVELMISKDLVEIEIIDGENKIHLKRPQSGVPTVTQVPIATAPAVQAAPAAQTEDAKEQACGGEEVEGLTEIKSPIIGTFYSSASPESDPFVTIGTRVEPETIVCIVEAMKVMNEIKAETTGTIVEELCKAGQAVEYGQAIFKVRPD